MDDVVRRENGRVIIRRPIHNVWGFGGFEGKRYRMRG